jgi:FKBP-type peptidyl-prolyl cis-trans isomerase
MFSVVPVYLVHYSRLSCLKMIQGLKDVIIIEMKAGGKRRALIPPQVVYTDESVRPIPEEAEGGLII